MLDWLKTLVGKAPAANPDGVSAAGLAHLSKGFRHLALKHPKLAARAVRHVVDGGDPEVLLALAATPGTGSDLRLLCVTDMPLVKLRRAAQRGTFVSDLAAEPPPVLRRLADVLEAASRSAQRDLRLEPELGSGAWLEVFLRQAIPLWGWSPGERRKFDLTSATVEAMLRHAEEDPALHLKVALSGTDGDWQTQLQRQSFQAFPDFAEGVVRHRDAIAAHVVSLPGPARRTALELMQREKVPTKPFARELADLATCPAKTVRAAAEAMLLQLDRDERHRLVVQRAREGSATERYHAVRLLHRLAGDAARADLRSLLEGESSKKVAAEIETLLGRIDAGAMREEPRDAPRAPDLIVEPRPPVGEPARLPNEILERLEEMRRRVNAELEERRKEADAHERRHILPKPLPESHAREAFEAMHSARYVAGTPSRPRRRTRAPLAPYVFGRSNWWSPLRPDFLELLKAPAIDLAHLGRILVASNAIDLDRGSWWAHGAFSDLVEAWASVPGRDLDLRGLAGALEPVGVSSRQLCKALLDCPDALPGLRARDDAWELFTENLPPVLDALHAGRRASTVGALDGQRTSALSALAAFPRLPRPALPLLWELALEGPKADRALAQACLEHEPGFASAVVEALQDGKQDVRATAARWISRLGEEAAPGATAALQRRLKKEKQEVALAAMLDALEALGESVDPYLGRDELSAEAERKLAKGVPKAMQWSSLAALPPVRWKDRDEPLDPKAVAWLLAQACQLKSPEPGSLLRRRASLLRVEDREALGQSVLSAWLAHDTARPSAEEATAQARLQAKQAARWIKKKDELAHYESQVRRSILATPTGSATPSRGLLAVVAVCGGAWAVPPIQRYLKEWYGQRAPQCKALLRVLAWIDHPAATQALLSVATRFRTKGIQAEARQIVEELAERRGWTMDQLADRTIPTAGLDECGVLPLDFGARRFEVRLDDALKPVVFTEGGKRLKNLPKPGKDDDPEKADAAKKRLSACRKELKQVVQSQRERLLEAACTQRAWSFEEWDELLHAHPVAGRLASRLVWSAWRGDELVATFRPLGDGSLSDVEDADVEAEALAGTSVRLAHATTLPDETVAAWTAHVADYEVETLFPQFGRPARRLPDALRTATELKVLEGHVIEAFALRGVAGKLGWTRGTAEDGGVFSTYGKAFPGLGLEAEIEHSGSYLPEENIPVALKSLAFWRPSRNESSPWSRACLKLEDVPPALLSECWNDMADMAAAGSGFDPDWKKKGLW